METNMLVGATGLRVPDRGVGEVWDNSTKPKIEFAELSDTYGKFIVEPLERGFGVTLGNALRRGLLSSVSGAGGSSAKIEKGLHQLSTLPGGVEDVPPGRLNLTGLSAKA